MNLPGDGSWRRVGKAWGGEQRIVMSLLKYGSAPFANDFVLAGGGTEARRLSAMLVLGAKMCFLSCFVLVCNVAGLVPVLEMVVFPPTSLEMSMLVLMSNEVTSFYKKWVK